MKNTITSLFLFLLIAFKSNAAEYKTITVEPYLIITNDWAFKKMVIHSKEIGVDYIEGFDFEWGYNYTLKIKIEKIPNPPADGSSVQYSLVKIISKTKVSDDYKFRMLITSNPLLGEENEVLSTFQSINDSTYLYFEKIEIEVPAAFQSELNRIVKNEMDKYGQFMIISEKKIRLLEIAKN